MKHSMLSTEVYGDTVTGKEIAAILSSAPTMQMSEVERLVSDHDRHIVVLERTAVELEDTERTNAITDLCRAYNSSQVPSLNIDLDKAKLAQLSLSWKKVFDMSKVQDLMSAEAKDDLEKQIDNPKDLPPFNAETIEGVVRDLYSRTGEFFVDSVDYLFQKLSKEHVTNQPNGFYKRMIYSGGAYGEYSDSHRKIMALIHDLRRCISRLIGRDHYITMATTESAIKHSKANYGDWTPVDGGSLHIKCFLNGNIHVRVHPDVAILLNGVLASKYPAAIPAKKRSRSEAKSQRKKKEWKFNYMDDLLPASVINYIAALEAKKNYERTDDFRQSMKYTGQIIVRTASYSPCKCEQTLKFVGKIMDYLGAEPYVAKNGKVVDNWWLFESGNFGGDAERSMKNILNRIVAEGCIPNFKSYQYYPTPESIISDAIEAAGIKSGELWGEFSAGQGNIVGAMLDKGARVSAVEISHLHCDIIKEKHPDAMVIEADFLEINLRSKYDGFIINPPYSKGRWMAHVEKAVGMLKDNKCGYAVLPGGYASKLKSCDEYDVEELKVYCNHFDNTNVTTKLVKIIKK